MRKLTYLLVASGGGHLKELYEALPEKFDFDNSVLLTYRTKLISTNSHDVRFIINPHKSLFKYLLCFVQTLFYFFRYRPNIIISTGAGIAVPSIILAKLFKIKIIYIETAANIFTPSKTGQFAYRYADLFVIQYSTLKEHYPNSVIGRLI